MKAESGMKSSACTRRFQPWQLVLIIVLHLLGIGVTKADEGLVPAPLPPGWAFSNSPDLDDATAFYPINATLAAHFSSKDFSVDPMPLPFKDFQSVSSFEHMKVQIKMGGSWQDCNSTTVNVGEPQGGKLQAEDKDSLYQNGVLTNGSYPDTAWEKWREFNVEGQGVQPDGSIATTGTYNVTLRAPLRIHFSTRQ